MTGQADYFADFKVGSDGLWHWKVFKEDGQGGYVEIMHGGGVGSSGVAETLAIDAIRRWSRGGYTLGRKVIEERRLRG